jgi:hypothetical protein
MIELAHKHESYAHLKNDVHTKALLPATSICVVLGSKIYPNTFQVFLATRDTVQGVGMAPLTARTGFETGKNMGRRTYKYYHLGARGGDIQTLPFTTCFAVAEFELAA